MTRDIWSPETRADFDQRARTALWKPAVEASDNRPLALTGRAHKKEEAEGVLRYLNRAPEDPQGFDETTSDGAQRSKSMSSPLGISTCAPCRIGYTQVWRATSSSKPGLAIRLRSQRCRQ